MTRSHAILKLLELGPLSVAQVHEIGGWPCYRHTQRKLSELRDAGLIRRVRWGRYACVR